MTRPRQSQKIRVESRQERLDAILALPLLKDREPIGVVVHGTWPCGFCREYARNVRRVDGARVCGCGTVEGARLPTEHPLSDLPLGGGIHGCHTPTVVQDDAEYALIHFTDAA